jgi:Phospholipase_D-nuclease N-terminal
MVGWGIFALPAAFGRATGVPGALIAWSIAGAGMLMLALVRRRDVSGFGKVLWVILLIVLPYIGIFAYFITQGGGMAERNKAQAIQARDEIRQVVGFSIADELAKLDRQKSEKSISDEEYLRLRARLVA